MGDISEHFSAWEMRCRCGQCALVLPSKRLLRGLEDLRWAIGVPIFPTSCVRCPTHNRAVGGVDKSRHLTFWLGIPRNPDAADVVVPGITLKSLFAYALEVPAFQYGGIGVYPHWPGLHLDARGAPARWYQEKKGGKMTGIPPEMYPKI